MGIIGPSGWTWPGNKFNQEYDRVRTPKPIPLLPFPARSDKHACAEQQRKEDRIIEQLVKEAETTWTRHLADGDTESAWRVWCEVAETFFLELCEEETLQGPEKGYRGRSSATRLQKASLLPKPGPVALGAAPADLRRRIRLQRRLRTLRHLRARCPRGDVEQRKLWATVRRNGRELYITEEHPWATSGFAGKSLPFPERLKELGNRVSAHSAQLQSKQQRRKRQRWKDHLRKTWRGRRKRVVYRWAKSEWRDNCKFPQRSDGSWGGKGIGMCRLHRYSFRL